MQGSRSPSQLYKLCSDLNWVLVVFELLESFGIFTEAVVHRCSSKQLFLKTSPISQKTSALEPLSNKAASLKGTNFIKKGFNTGVLL